MNEDQHIIELTKLHTILDDDYDETCKKSDADFFYLILLKVLNRKDRILVYNYLPLSNKVYYWFIRYNYNRSRFLHKAYIEPGRFSLVIDWDYINVYGDNFGIHKQAIESGFYDKCAFNHEFSQTPEIWEEAAACIHDTQNLHGDSKLKAWLKLVNHLSYYLKPYLMPDVVDMAFNNDYENILHMFIDKTYAARHLKKPWIGSSDHPVNFLNGLLFLCDHNYKDNLIKPLVNKKYNVSQGPQSTRGCVNTLNNFLLTMDYDFRDNLYNHYNYYCVDNIVRLHKKEFSFKNFHNKFGNIKYYSTNTTESDRYTKPLMDKHRSVHSKVYDQLIEILINNPTNIDTQKLLENLIPLTIKLKIEWDSSKTSNNVINYDLIKDSTKLLGDTSNSLNLEIDKIRNRKYQGPPFSTNKKQRLLYSLHVMISGIPNKDILSILLGKLLVIINPNNKLVSTETNINLDIGKNIIRSYYYNLYKNHLEEFNVKSRDYGLHDWKINNAKIIKDYDYEDHDFAGNIGCIVVYWLVNEGLIESKYFKTVDKSYSLYTPTILLNETLNTDTNLDIPSHLPMIVKPNTYGRIDNKNGTSTELLGGYLLNNEKYTDTIIKNKWNMSYPSKLKDNNIIYGLVNDINSVSYKINSDVLTFIINHNEEFNFLYLDDCSNLSLESKISGDQYNRLEAYLSKKQSTI